MRTSIPPFAIVLVALATVPLFGAESRESDFLAGLRERRLFALAEGHCRRLLESQELGEIERAEITCEWMRTLAQHAWHAPPAERAALWAAAQEVAAKFQSGSPNHPRLVLVRLQEALTHLARGELARQEAEHSPERAARIAEAQESFREAVKRLETLREEAERLARTPPRTPSPAALAPGELLSLVQNIRLQEARAFRNQAQCYPPASADWTSSLQQAVAAVEPLVASLEPDDLTWRARLEEAIDRRLLADMAAARRIDAYLAASPPPELKLALTAERVRVDLGAGRLDEAVALLGQGRSAEGETSAELDFAHLEAYLALWQRAEKAKDEAGIEKWQKSAVDTAAALERLHGPYWARRAQSLLASAAGQGERVGNLEVLVAAAENHVRLARWAEAIAAYDLAAAKADAAKLTDRAIAFAMAAAAIEFREKHYAAARDRYRRLALSLPQHANAAGAHWNAVTCEALLARAAPSANLDAYAALLAEHLARWPEGETSDKARWFLGRLLEDRRQWVEAAAAYRAIRAEFPQAAEAATALARCHEANLADLNAANKPIAEPIAAAVADLEAIILGPAKRVPEKWSPAARAAVLGLARVRLAYDTTSHAAIAASLQAALADGAAAPPEWLSESRALLVIALAGSERRPGAAALLAELAQASPKQLWEVARGLSAAAKNASPAVRSELAKLQLQAVAAVKPGWQQLPAADQASLRRMEAEAKMLAGDAAGALASYEQLAKDFPADGDVQEAFAKLLSADTSPAGQERALVQWRYVLQRSRPQSERWFAAQLSVAETLVRLNRKREAAESIQLLLARPPGLDATPLKAKFLEVLRGARS